MGEGTLLVTSISHQKSLLSRWFSFSPRWDMLSVSWRVDVTRFFAWQNWTSRKKRAQQRSSWEVCGIASFPTKPNKLLLWGHGFLLGVSWWPKRLSEITLRCHGSSCVYEKFLRKNSCVRPFWRSAFQNSFWNLYFWKGTPVDRVELGRTWEWCFPKCLFSIFSREETYMLVPGFALCRVS